MKRINIVFNSGIIELSRLEIKHINTSQIDLLNYKNDHGKFLDFVLRLSKLRNGFK